MKEIQVWADWGNMTGPNFVGRLSAGVVKGKEVFSFEYEPTWTQQRNAFQIDPQLHLFTGRYHPPEGAENFGVFLDSSPDRWGRILMQRREALLARTESRPPRKLMPSDYLLGVYDQTRMGGLRFKFEGGPFLGDQVWNPTPPWTSLRALEAASLKLEEEGVEDDPHFTEWLNIILAPGSSLGGARPKASVVDPDGRLWIAKFPSKDDEKDVGAWEAIVHELAEACGLKVPEAQALKFGHKYHTFLSRRFDRSIHQKRIHFSSAMTLLEHRDGDNFESGASYLELVDFIISHGASHIVNRDLEELWRRIVFSIAVSNSDDHLRNHGFLLNESGWELSPAYDINPNEFSHGLSLNISHESNALDFELAMEVSEFFRLKPGRGKEIISEIQSTIMRWPELAKKYSISRSEQERMRPAFRGK